MPEHTARRDPASHAAVNSRNAIAATIAGMFAGSQPVMAPFDSLDVATVILPYSAGRVFVRSTTAGTEDVRFTAQEIPVDLAVDALAVLAGGMAERLLYLQNVAADAR
jgi:hypothetical protein